MTPFLFFLEISFTFPVKILRNSGTFAAGAGRPAPAKPPQGRNAARICGRSGVFGTFLTYLVYGQCNVYPSETLH